MKRAFLAPLFLSLALSAFAAPASLGKIEYVEGKVVITRASKTISDVNIDDPIFSGDMIRTESDGLLVIVMDKSTGMSGKLTVKSKSAFYIRTDLVSGQSRTSVQMLAGSIASKVAKIAGSPTFQVQSDSAVMGVRGTQFAVSMSVNGSMLVICSESSVEVSDGTDKTIVPAGKALLKRPGERFRMNAVAISGWEEFQERWVADEIEAFRANPEKVLTDFQTRYTQLASEFALAFEAFQKSAVLTKWIEEDKAGKAPRALDPTVMAEKKEMIVHIQKIRKILFIFERIYYRILEVADLGLERHPFVLKVLAEKDSLARRVALFRYAEQLYAIRNEGSSGMGMDDDFFGGSDF